MAIFGLTVSETGESIRCVQRRAWPPLNRLFEATSFEVWREPTFKWSY